MANIDIANSHASEESDCENQPNNPAGELPLPQDPARLTPNVSEASAADADDQQTKEKPGMSSPAEEGTPSKSKVSQRKKAANRLNSQRSTGAKTAQGKKNSSRNAITHGIFAHEALYDKNGELRSKKLLLLAKQLRDQYGSGDVRTEILIECTLVDYTRNVAAFRFERDAYSQPGSQYSSRLDLVHRYATGSRKVLLADLEMLHELKEARGVEEDEEIGREDDPQPAEEFEAENPDDSVNPKPRNEAERSAARHLRSNSTDVRSESVAVEVEGFGEKIATGVAVSARLASSRSNDQPADLDADQNVSPAEPGRSLMEEGEGGNDNRGESETSLLSTKSDNDVPNSLVTEAPDPVGYEQPADTNADRPSGLEPTATELVQALLEVVCEPSS